MNDILDLNDLAPQARQVKIGEIVYDIDPPDTNDMMRVGVIGQELRDNKDLEPKTQSDLIVELRTIVNRCAPELETARITMQQLLRLLDIILDMGTPAETKELAAKGIEPASPKVQG